MQDPYSDNAKQFGPFDENSSTRIERLLRDAKNAAALRHALAMIDIEGAHRLAWLRSHFNRDQPRVPAGHPEGYLEAFAQLYTDLAEQIYARRENRKPSPASLLVPTVEDGVEGMRFIAATLESSKRNAAWVNLQSISK